MVEKQCWMQTQEAAGKTPFNGQNFYQDLKFAQRTDLDMSCGTKKNTVEQLDVG